MHREDNVADTMHEESDLKPRTDDRRIFSVLTVFRSLTHARRRDHRRDNQDPYTQTDWYHPRLFFIVLGVVALSITDAIFTLKLISQGAIEANPVMAYFLEISILAFVSAKMILTGVSMVFLTAFSSFLLFNRFRMERFMLLSLFGYCLLIIYELVLLTKF